MGFIYDLRQNKCRHNVRHSRHFGRRKLGNAERFLWRGGSGASRVSSPTPDHEPDCLHNCSATPSRCSSSETASQMVFRYLASAPWQCASHVTLIVREFLAKHSIPVVPHPPYSPDLVLCDFFLFSRVKSTMKNKRFQDVAEIQLNTTRQLQAIPKQACQTCIEKWKDRCIQSGLESLFTIWRVVLWRRGGCRCFRFPTINSVPDIFDHPSYRTNAALR
jgi:transposase